MAQRKAQTAAEAPANEEKAQVKKRTRISQEDVPAYSLEQALRVAKAIGDNYAYKPTRPMHVASAISMSPTSGPFRTITGSAVAYGLTTGAAQAPEIGITPLGLRIVRPTTEGDDVAAKREALLRPKIIGDFLRHYDGAAIPTDEIAKNVLQELGVPTDRVADVLDLIVQGAHSVGFLRDISGKRYVDLASQPVPPETRDEDDEAPQSVPPTPLAPPVLPMTHTPPPAVSVGQGVHINIEIHIAADASSTTIEDIFRNMRRYVLAGDGQVDSNTANGE